MKSKKNVPEEEALTYVSSVEASHFYTSAKLNKGLDEIFMDLAKSEPHRFAS